MDWLRLLYPFHLTHPPLSGHDGTPSCSPSIWQEDAPCPTAKYEDLCDHHSEHGTNCRQRRTCFHQIQASRIYDRTSGTDFDGVISGVTEWGLYVELNENKCEGMIPIRDLDDDYYEFDEKNYCLRGRRKNKIYSLGDAITIKVARR